MNNVHFAKCTLVHSTPCEGNNHQGLRGRPPLGNNCNTSRKWPRFIENPRTELLEATPRIHHRISSPLPCSYSNIWYRSPNVRKAQNPSEGTCQHIVSNRGNEPNNLVLTPKDKTTYKPIFKRGASQSSQRDHRELHKVAPPPPIASQTQASPPPSPHPPIRPPRRPPGQVPRRSVSTPSPAPPALATQTPTALLERRTAVRAVALLRGAARWRGTMSMLSEGTSMRPKTPPPSAPC